ncbi:hypothetical protein [Candidatus Enterococcus ferrettii]|uniref:Uncharacterized protein n=1 Tax=Candidatus Enterococcus ferrettii TaxID=2815324 RepID=A0ABV0F1B9_9ENTE|nr:hypothetical protein [Enterococcus sp. 665A]MBO1340355.1 hypothetical protein [Enterococcus sp. 665A]
MNDKLTVKTLIEDLELLEHIKEAKNRRTSRICLDNHSVFEKQEMLAIENELNELYSEYTFEIIFVMSGFGQDLIITNKQAKAEYDSMPKTRTYGELYNLLVEKYGITRNSKLKENPDKSINDIQFNEILDFELSLNKLLSYAYDRMGSLDINKKF